MALSAHTNEGIAMTKDEAKKLAETKIVPRLLLTLPDKEDVVKATVGVCNNSRGNLRTQEHYPAEMGWQATGAKTCIFPPIEAAHTGNQLSARRLEAAVIEALEPYHTMGNERGGGGGTLGLKTGKRDHNGKAIRVSDPTGYKVYCVFIPTAAFLAAEKSKRRSAFFASGSLFKKQRTN